jgi:hypothetical protein
LKEAEVCVRRIVGLYQRPNMTADQFREALEAQALDPLKEFSAACRAEVTTFRRTGLLPVAR